MGIITSVKDKIENARESVERKIDRVTTPMRQASEKSAQARRATAAIRYQEKSDRIDEQYKRGEISPELAARQRQRADMRRERESTSNIERLKTRATGAIRGAASDYKKDLLENMFSPRKVTKKPAPSKTTAQRERGRPRTYDKPQPARYNTVGGFKSPTFQPRKSIKKSAFNPLDMWSTPKKKSRKMPRGWF